MSPEISNVLIVVIIAIILFFAIKNSISHFKGEGACCGGGSKKGILIKPKKLDKIIEVRKIGIKGMHCENCSRRVQNALNSIDGINAKVKLSREVAIIKLGKEIDNKMIEKTITDLGYEVIREGGNEN